MSDLLTDQVEAVRAFNRFYTSFIGALSDHFSDSDYALTPMRIVYQLGAADTSPTAAGLARETGLDKGQLSRVLATLETDGLILRVPDPDHARRLLLSLTPAGQDLFRRIVAVQQDWTGARLSALTPADRTRLTAAMTQIRALLDGGNAGLRPVLRDLAPGDLGWIVMAQSQLYAAEFGWNGDYEALVLRILADFAARQPAARERGWVAEAGGMPLGAVLVMEKSPAIAQLRLLHVEAPARGTGLGGRLVDQCLAFARGAGYARLELWTNDVLSDARRLYQSRGFTLMEEARHTSFGADLNGQTWGVDLGA